jgi:hypothetical protein
MSIGARSEESLVSRSFSLSNTEILRFGLGEQIDLSQVAVARPSLRMTGPQAVEFI